MENGQNGRNPLTITGPWFVIYAIGYPAKQFFFIGKVRQNIKIRISILQNIYFF